jgi:hypothetical protein
VTDSARSPKRFDLSTFDRSILDAFAAAGPKLRRAVGGLSREELLATPVPGTWSIQQIVVHVMDSHLTAVDRMKRMLAMERPLLLGYDESAFAAKLHYDAWPIEDAVAVIDLVQRNFAAVLRRMPDEAFDRVGIHSETGVRQVGEMIAAYNGHLEHHLQFIRRKRAMLGKPLVD